MSSSLPGKTLLVTCDYKPMLGGIATYLHRLADALATAGCAVEVWAPPLPGDAAFDGQQRFATRRVAGLNRQGVNPGMARQLATAVRRGGVGRIISGLWMQTGVASLAASRLGHVPYYQLCYGIELMDSPHSRSWPAKRWLRARVLEGAAQVWAISDYTRMLAQAAAPRAAMRLLRPGINRERFSAAGDAVATRERWAIGARKLLLTVARLEDYKGIDRMLEAMTLVLADHPDVFYMIVGNGPYFYRLHEMVRERQLEASTVLTGSLTDDEVVALYQACDLYVMPSRMTTDPPNVEGFGISFLEASACGKPVVAGRSGGIPDAVADGVTGMLVDPEDAAAIARAVRTLLRDPAKARAMGDAGRVMAKARGWDAVGARAVQLMSEPWR